MVIAVTFALCSVVVTMAELGSNLSDASEFTTVLVGGLPFVLWFGGIPFLIGLGLYFGGRALYRAK